MPIADLLCEGLINSVPNLLISCIIRLIRHSLGGTGPLPWPVVDRNRRYGRLEAIGQRPRRAEPLPRAAYRQGKL